jgi:hypothetical protein
MHEMSPITPQELAAMRARRNPPVRRDAKDGAGFSLPSLSPALTSVVFDQIEGGLIWAAGPTYKASFGPEGFQFVPFFGSDAPKNYPVRLVLRAVNAGGQPVPFAEQATASRDGQRVILDRGVVREIYDFTVDHVEQTFVVDTALPGDIDLEVEVVSELTEDATKAGLQFANALGEVSYGTAYLVDGVDKRAIRTVFRDGRISMHVPAAQRAPGAIVIDPIIQASAFGASRPNDSTLPDIAYDTDADQYLVTWQYDFSVLDTDVLCEFRYGDGTVVPGSIGAVDVSTDRYGNPRVANNNLYDRFLVVMEGLIAGRWQIYGRLRLTNAAPHPILIPISDPNNAGHCVNADVGGDPGSGDHWLVVWERQLSSTDFDIHGRMVRVDTSMNPNLIFIENSAATIYSRPRVSNSNGNGLVITPRWVVVYQLRFNPTDWDIFGSAVDVSGSIVQTNTSIDSSLESDLGPQVSSPAFELSNGAPLFMVTHEHQSTTGTQARLLTGSLNNAITPVNLTTNLGLGWYQVQPESDGCRFAVTSSSANTAPVTVATLALANNTLVVHEAPQTLPGVGNSVALCSKRSGGSLVRTDYGIAYVNTTPTPDQVWVASYEGRSPGGSVSRRAMACGGLGINVAGRSYLGEVLQYSLSSLGSDAPGMLIGLPHAGVPLCLGCALGVDPAGPLAIVSNLSLLNLQIPCEANLIGGTLAVQGFAAGSGSCFGLLRFSDTIDFTIR